MPEFQLDTSGTIDCPSPCAPCICHARTFDQLDSFAQGYVTALFFTDGGPDEGQLGDAGFSDLAPDTLAAILADCANFQNAASLTFAEMEKWADGGWRMDRLGHDFWLTRNGHGAGFWDREELDIASDSGATFGNLLSDLAREFGTCDAYLGDDGKVYTC